MKLPTRRGWVGIEIMVVRDGTVDPDLAVLEVSFNDHTNSVMKGASGGYRQII